MQAAAERRLARQVPVARVLDHRSGSDLPELFILESEPVDERLERRREQVLIRKLVVGAIRTRERDARST